MNKAPRFWLDYRYAAVQTTIIFLGKIFDIDGPVFNIDRLLQAAYEDKEFFSKDRLRERKLELSAGGFDGLDEYINQASALDNESLKLLSAQAKLAKEIWAKIKPPKG